MPLAQIAEPWPTMELVQLETEVIEGENVYIGGCWARIGWLQFWSQVDEV